MEDILTKLGDIKICSPEDDKIKTGLIHDTKIFQSTNESFCIENFKLAYKKIISENCLDKCVPLKGRTLEEDELKFLADVDVNEIDNYLLGTSYEIVDKIITDNLTNGLVFTNLQTRRKAEEECSNNISLEALIAKLCLSKNDLKRIMIVNFDVNSNLLSQEEFYENSKVLNFAIHRNDGKLNDKSNFYNIGENEGKGFNVNLVLDNNGIGDSEYLLILYNILLPIAYEFNPELIIFPTTFNSVAGSSLNAKVSPSMFGHIIHALSCLGNGKICVLADGMNDSKLFADCVFSTLRSLLGYPIARLNNVSTPDSALIRSINKSIAVLRPYWYSLQPLNNTNQDLLLERFIENHKEKSLEETCAKPTENGKSLDTSSSRRSPRSLNIEEFSKSFEKIKSLSATNRTCLCTDEFMMRHQNLKQLEHPERPARIEKIVNALKEKNLYSRCGIIQSSLANENEIELCHSKQYIDSLKTLKEKTTEELIELSCNRESVYYHSDTFECAKMSTGCLLNVVDQVCSNKFSNGVSINRPPGHHANSNSCSGFCFFNSIAVAARYAQKNYKDIRKVLILDFDVHHGNGTQDIFKDDDSVLFISLHRYDNGFFYPMNSDSNYDFTGGEKAKGYTINVPWNVRTAGDSEYIAAFLRVVMPVAYEFNPDLVLVSAGFDAATGDPLGNFNISPKGYAQMTKMLSSLANGKIILGLEGGYNLHSISESMASCVSILLGDVCPFVPPINAKPEAYTSIKNVIETHKKYWSMLKTYEELPACEFIKKYKSDKPEKPKKPQIPISYSLRSKKTNSASSLKEPSKSESSELANKSNEEIRSKNELQKLNDIKSEEILNTELNQNINLKKMENLEISNEDNSLRGIVPVAVIPLPFCPHLLEINNKPDPKLVQFKTPCKDCNDTKENWLCLTCYGCCCSRYVKGHMSQHFDESKHPMVLSWSDMSVWCYVCDSYVNNEMLTEVKHLAYNSKFC